MILQLGRGVRWLDQYLQHRLGRPYNILLSVGLVTEIVERVRELPHALTSAPNEIRLALILIMELVLLLHQVSVLSEHIDKHRRRGRGLSDAEPR